MRLLLVPAFGPGLGSGHLRRCLAVARRCGFMVATRAPILPAFPTADGRSEALELRRQAEAGLAARLAGPGLAPAGLPAPGPPRRAGPHPAGRDRAPLPTLLAAGPAPRPARRDQARRGLGQPRLHQVARFRRARSAPVQGPAQALEHRIARLLAHRRRLRARHSA